MTNNDLNRLSRIVNKHINPFGKQTNKNDFLLTKNTKLLHFDSNCRVFDQIFNDKAPNRKETKKRFFHYKHFKYGYDFLNKEYITASALSNFIGVTDDIKEYEHFFEVAKIPCDKSYIDAQKDNFFITCFTVDDKTDRFWQKYADKHKGLCLEIELQNITSNPNLKSKYEFRDICYDDGNEFSFYSNMQNEIHNSFQKYLLTQGIAKFGALYKRKTKYNWEKETRLLINWGLYSQGLSKFIDKIEPNNKKLLKIPFKNKLFDINIKKVTIGKNLNCIAKKKIKILARRKNYDLKWDY
jgi:hypothetical protein